MSEMTGRQRLLCVLEGGLPDRAPVTAWIDGPFLARCVGRVDFDVPLETVRVSKELGLDVSLRVYLREVSSWETSDWCLRTRHRRTAMGQQRLKIIETPEGELRESVNIRVDETGLSFAHTEEYLVKGPADLELMQKYSIIRPPVDEAPLIAAQSAIGEDGIVVCYAGGAAHTTAALYLRGLEQLTVDALETPGFYDALLEWAIVYETGLLDTVAQLGPDLCQVGGLYAQGNFVGPHFYERRVLPYDRRFIAEAHRRGLRTTYHNCGTSRALLALYCQLGTDAFETFPPPPLGDGDLAFVKRVLGDQMVLIGNVDQVHLLRTQQPADVRQVVTETMLVGKEGGHFILSPADQLPSDTPVENVRMMAEAARVAGRY